jgi:ABC-type Fe3+-citrate transport system substrate-binding protein
LFQIKLYTHAQRNLEKKLKEIDEKIKKNLNLKNQVNKNKENIKKLAEHFKKDAENKTGLKENDKIPSATGVN